jgi:hypothetical protein
MDETAKAMQRCFPAPNTSLQKKQACIQQSTPPRVGTHIIAHTCSLHVSPFIAFFVGLVCILTSEIAELHL